METLEENGDERSELKFSDYTPERKRRSMHKTHTSTIHSNAEAL